MGFSIHLKLQPELCMKNPGHQQLFPPGQLYGNKLKDFFCIFLNHFQNFFPKSFGQILWNIYFNSNKSLTTGFWCIGGMIGALSGGAAANFFGRKLSLILTNIFTLTGAFLEAYSMATYCGPTFDFADNLYDFMLAGRFINGIGCGLCTTLGKSL